MQPCRTDRWLESLVFQKRRFASSVRISNMLETNKELAQSFLGINGHSWKFQHNRSVDKKPQRARSWMWWCMIVSNILKLNKKNVATISYLQQAPWLDLLPPSDKRLPNPNGHHLTIEKDVLTVFRLDCVWKASRPQKAILKFRCLHEASDERDNWGFSMKFQTYATYLSCLVFTVQLVIDGIGIKTYFAAKPPYHARQRSEQQLKHGCRQKTSTIDVLRKWALKEWRSNQYTVTVVKWLKKTGFENAIAQKATHLRGE